MNEAPQRKGAIVASLLVAIALAPGCQIMRQLGQAQTITAEGRRNPPDETRTYKQTPTRDLRMHVFLRDDNVEPLEKLVPVLLVHGGGFTHGWPEELFPLAEDLARNGHIGFVPEYRIHSLDETGVPEALSDLRDAVAWLHENAPDFAVDPEKLVLGGSSAGAYLVATLATEARARTTPRPAGLFLSAAYVDSTGVSQRIATANAGPPSLTRLFTGPSVDVFEGQSDELSPHDKANRNMPPTLMQLGANDPLVPSAQAYCQSINEKGGQCEIKLHQRAGHAYALATYPAYPEMLKTLQEAIASWTN